MLTLHASRTGTLPDLATAYPLEGAFPRGQVLDSLDDTTLRSSVISTWPDGSAQVVILAGETEVTSRGATSIRLRSRSAKGTALTTANIAARLNRGGRGSLNTAEGGKAAPMGEDRARVTGARR